MDRVFGNVISLLRKKRGLTQGALSELTSIHPTHIGRIERGEQSVTLKTAEKIAQGFDTNLWDILRLVENPNELCKLKK